MASLQVETTGAAVSASAYTVRWQITAATDMPSEVFLVDFATNTFQGVVTPSVLVFPTTRTSGQGFYRLSDVTATFASLTEAQNARINVRAALLQLIQIYEDNISSFLGTTTETLSV